MRSLIVTGLLCTLVCGGAGAQYPSDPDSAGAVAISDEALILSEYLLGSIHVDMDHARMVEAELAEIRTLRSPATPDMVQMQFRPRYEWSTLVVGVESADYFDTVTAAVSERCGVVVESRREQTFGLHSWMALKFAGIVNPVALEGAVGRLPHVRYAERNGFGYLPESAPGRAGLYVTEDNGRRTYVFVAERQTQDYGPYMEWLCYQARSGVPRLVGYWNEYNETVKPPWRELVEAALSQAGVR